MKVGLGKENNSDYWRPKVNDNFDSVWNNILGKAQDIVAMEQNLENHDFDLKDANVKILKKNAEKLNKCNQCDYASSHAGHLRTHLKTHSGEKPNKCNECDYASSHPSHLKIHSGEKSY